MKLMNKLWNEKETELTNLLALKEKLLSDFDTTTLANYLITIADLEGLELKEEEKESILDFFEKNNDTELQLYLFAIFEYGKTFNYLNALRYGSFRVLSIKDLLQKREYGKKELDIRRANEIIDNNELKQFKTFCKYFSRVWRNTTEKKNTNNPLIKLMEKLSEKGFYYYQNYLEYIFNIKLTKTEQDTNITTRIKFKNRTNKIKNKTFLSPIEERILNLKMEQKQKEKKEKNLEQKQEKAFKIIDSFIQNNAKRFIELSPQITKYFSSPEIETYALNKIINHNEEVIKQLQIEKDLLKKQLDDSYELVFLESDYDLPEETIMKEIKESLTKESLTKLLKALSKKEFSFLNSKHPNFLEILQNTNELTLKEISKEISDKIIPITYLISYPKILTTSTFLLYKKNKELVLQNNLNIDFFHNSNILLLDSDTLQKVVDLIKTYHCETLICYGLNYFDQVDALIEQRFNLLPDTLEVEDFTTTKVQELLNKQIPLTMTSENENEIAWLDEEFKVDSLRYCINGFIISRIKVLRYFTSLNQCKEDRNQNLLDAIFYNTHFFEFEKQMIMDALKRNQTRKKIISQFQE